MEEKIDTFKKDIMLNFSRPRDPPYSSFEAFGTQEFYDLEKVYYVYLKDVFVNFAEVIKTSFDVILQRNRTKLIIISVIILCYSYWNIDLYFLLFHLKSNSSNVCVSR